MRTRSALALAALLTLASACKSATPAPSTAPAPMPAPAPAPAAVAAPAAATVDPSGKWSVALTAQGQAFDFVMELRRIGGAEFGGGHRPQQFGGALQGIGQGAVKRGLAEEVGPQRQYQLHR